MVNRIHRAHGVDLLIAQTQHVTGLSGFRDKIRASVARGSAAPFRARLPVKVRSRAEAAMYDRVFGDDWMDVDDGVPLMLARSINGDDVERRLAELAPDVLIVHGTALLKENILKTAPNAWNLHWGLSPYYRGTNCTDWAMLLWDVLNIGVTIHELSSRIDGGDVIAQARPQIEPADTVYSINAKLSKCGTDLIVRAIDELAEGRTPPASPQDLANGCLTLNRHWSKALRRHLRRMIRRGDVGRMLERPSRPALPIASVTGSPSRS